MVELNRKFLNLLIKACENKEAKDEIIKLMEMMVESNNK